MKIAGQMEQVDAWLDQYGLVSSLEGSTTLLSEAIESIAERALQPMNPFDEIALRRFDRQVVVIPHHAVGVNLPFGLFARLPQTIDECRRGFGCAEDPVPRVSAIHHMINRARKLNARNSCH